MKITVEYYSGKKDRGEVANTILRWLTTLPYVPREILIKDKGRC